MKTNQDKILDYIREKTSENESVAFTTQEISEVFHIQRANVSTSLNRLVAEGKLRKQEGRPTKYLLNTAENSTEEDAFSSLIGASASLKYSIRLAKAFLVYPENVDSFIIYGESGTGKERFGRAMYAYAIAKQIIDASVPLEVYDLAEYDSDDDFFNALQQNMQNQRRFLLIKHIEKISAALRRRLLEYYGNHPACDRAISVCTYEIPTGGHHVKSDDNFPFQINLPALDERTLQERLDFIRTFFQKESESLHKEIVINSELLRCLLLYECQYNIKQLENDIRIGCANAFVRQTGRDFDKLYVYLNDCHSYVRRGFLKYKERRKEIEGMIPKSYTYTYSYANREVKKTAGNETGIQTDSIYGYIDEKVKELKERELSKEDIMTIVSTDIEEDFSVVVDQIQNQSYDPSALEKIVDSSILSAVEEFLKNAAIRFNRVYSLSVYQSLCIQISSALKSNDKSCYITNAKVKETVDKYPEEYAFAKRFATSLQKEFSVTLSMDDVILITLALCHENKMRSWDEAPHILIIMHGTVASSVAKAVNTLYEDANVYSYDLLLESDINKAYEEIRTLCLKIANSKGLLVFYDMGSLKTILNMVAQETGIIMRMIELPITLFALAAAFKFSSYESLDSVYEQLLKQGFGSFQSLGNEITRKDAFSQKYIITLCMSGSGSAQQIKQYLEKNANLTGTTVIPLALDNHKALVDTINYYAQTGEIKCIVGTYDPKLYNIPYVSVAQLFDTPMDKLDLLLSVEYNELGEDFNYKELYDYLDEQLESVDIHKIKRTMHRTIRQMKRKIRSIDAGEEVGLFMHLACAIERIKTEEEPYVNLYKDKVISQHKTMYNDVKEILEDLEVDAEVVFNDDEIATIMEILE